MKPHAPVTPALLPRLAASWLLLAGADLVLTTTLSGRGLRAAGVPLGTRAGLTALDLILLLAAVMAIGFLLRTVARSTQRLGRTTQRWLIGPAAVLLNGVSVLVYASSWGVFWITGTFLDRNALAFWLAQPVQVLHWVYPPLAVHVVLATTVMTTVLVRWVPQWIDRDKRGRLLLRIAIGVAVCCGVLAMGEAVTYGWRTLGRPASPYAVASGAHAGPLAHALFALRVTPEAPAPLATRAEAVTGDIVRPSIITMDQYLARVDRARVRPFNVVMVQIESLRRDQLRAYGGVRDVMPTIDGLARGGRVFTTAYVQASHSNYADPVPLSSQYPLRYRQAYDYPEHPPYPRVLIYDVLKALGYKTAIFSSQNENWGGMINYHRPDRLDRFFHAATFTGPTYTPWEDAGFAEWVKATGGAGSVDDRYTVNEALEWIDTLGTEPFFLHMNLQSSHLPYVLPARFKRRFSPDTLDFTIQWGSYPRDRIQTVKDRYADSLYYIDTQIARLFAQLQRRQLWDNTIIVIGGDNGEAFYEHGFAAHASWLFDEVVRVPMIVRAPGLAPGSDSRPAMFLDVPPTLLDLLNLPPHPGFQGISVLASPPAPGRSIYIVAQTPAASELAIVRNGMKLHYLVREQRLILNDLAADPGETMDLRTTRPEVLQDLARRLQRWRDEQLAYYADAARQAREYPPVFRD
jgi:arylsulfatase A-like enzyme